MNEEHIKKVHASFQESEHRRQALTGERYYRNLNDIVDRKLYIYTKGAGVVEDPYKSNNKVPTSFYKYIVDQKINYILGQKPTLEEPLNTNDIYKTTRNMSKKASIKGVQWAFIYPEGNVLKLKPMVTEQLHPVFEEETLVAMYRFYNKDNAQWAVMYTMNEQITFKDYKHFETRPHATSKCTMGTLESISDVSIGFVPFIPLYNNEDAIYDLEPIKAMIDIYDKNISDFANNLEDFQDVYWILKNYNGQDLASFTEEIKKYKTLRVGEGGDASAQTIDIPHEARAKMLGIMEALIFKFAFAVDIDKLAGGADLTNVAIKAVFNNLDMKCNMFASEVQDFLDKYVGMYNQYATKIGIPLIDQQDIKFNKSTIVNESALLKGNAEQRGQVSEDTRLKNHPWVIDVDEELKLMGEVLSIPE